MNYYYLIIILNEFIEIKINSINYCLISLIISLKIRNFIINNNFNNYSYYVEK
jgi:hypothetical protein